MRELNRGVFNDAEGIQFGDDDYTVEQLRRESGGKAVERVVPGMLGAKKQELSEVAESLRLDPENEKLRAKYFKLAGANDQGLLEQSFEELMGILTPPSEAEEAKAEVKKQDAVNKSQSTKQRDEKQAEKIAKAMVKEEQRTKLLAIAEELGFNDKIKGFDNEVLRDLIVARREESPPLGFSREFLEAAGISSPTPVRDLYISKGRAYKLDSKDDVLASKPGGAVDRVMGGGSGGTTFNATFHINGGGEQQAKEVVRQLENWVKTTRGGSR